MHDDGTQLPPSRPPNSEDLTSAGTPRPDPHETPTAPVAGVGPLGLARIGKYRLTRLLGQGGMGNVYEAVQEGTEQRVALKLVRAEAADAVSLARFEAETKILGRLRHPHLAQVFDSGVHETDDRGRPVPYLVMELVAGAWPLVSYARAWKLTTVERLRLFLQVCEGVAAAHAAGIVHRDLKPSNILVEAQPSTGLDGTRGVGRVKVIDFGIALVRATPATPNAAPAPPAAPSPPSPAAEGFVGTVRYMSPQQTDERVATLDHRSDIYALGVILHELLAGHLPYPIEHMGTAQAALVIRHEPPERLGDTDPDLRGDIEAIVLRCLEKEPADRYQSAADLARDLRRVARGEPLNRPGVNIAHQLAARVGWIATRHALAAALACTLLALAAWTALAGPTLGSGLPIAWARAARSAQSPVLAPTDPVRRFDRVRLIEITDATRMNALAESLGIKGVEDRAGNDDTPDARAARRSWRRVYATLVGQLADAGTRVIAFDIIFGDDSDADADFATAIARAKTSAGVDTVVGVPDAIPGLPKATKLAGRLAGTVRLGMILGAPAATGWWYTWTFLPTANVSTNPPATAPVGDPDRRDALALSAVASYLRPGAAARFSWVGDPLLAFSRPLPGGGAAGIPEGLPLPIGTGLLRPVGPTSDAAAAVELRSRLDIPPDAAFAAASVEIGRFMAWTPDQRRAWCGGKAVLVANNRTGIDDKFVLDAPAAGSSEATHPVPDERRTIRGSWTHMTAIEAVLRLGPRSLAGDRRWEWPPLFAAALGVGVGWRWWRRPWTSALALVGIAVGVVVCSLAAFVALGLLWYPFGVVAACWLGTSLSLWTFRRRSRVLFPRRPRAIGGA